MIAFTDITADLAQLIASYAGEHWTITGDLTEVEFRTTGRAAVINTSSSELIPNNSTYELQMQLTGAVVYNDALDADEARERVNDLLTAFVIAKGSLLRYSTRLNGAYRVLGITGGAMTTEASEISYNFTVGFTLHIQL